MKWLAVAREVANQTRTATFVYTDTGEAIGKPKSEVLMNDLEEPEGELERLAMDPKAPRRLRSGRRVMLDMTTAHMLCVVYDALNEKNKAHFASLPLLKAVNVGWQLVRPKA